MIGIDTNVLVRYIAQDDAAQSARATQLLEALSEDEPGFISHIVLVELAWVLERAYNLDRQGILRVLRKILGTRSLIVENASLATQAIRLYADGSADFSDCLVQRTAQAAGCECVYTFDRVASRDTGMSLL